MGTVVTCACMHTTNFAVLLSLDGSATDDDDDDDDQGGQGQGGQDDVSGVTDGNDGNDDGNNEQFGNTTVGNGTWTNTNTTTNKRKQKYGDTGKNKRSSSEESAHAETLRILTYVNP